MAACFKGAAKLRCLYFIILKEQYASCDLFILNRVLRKFLAVSSTTMELLPLGTGFWTPEATRNSGFHTFGLPKIGLSRSEFGRICC